ncbi:MAG: hypothetical protein JWN86_2030 [Planctomycetota bacterium]|nr:hypothetical protein [Planctomycetota bacterium]
MALRLRFQYAAGASLGYSIERLSDGLLYNFAPSGSTAGTFTAAPTTVVAPLPADTGSFVGRYKVNLTSTPAAQFVDGDYCITIHNVASGNAVIAELDVVMHNGDDATVIPSGASADPWNQSLPGSYAAGTAGFALGTNLDAKVSTRLAATSYAAPPTDYQQRSQPVVLPFVAPIWYAAPPSDYQQRNQPVMLPTTSQASSSSSLTVAQIVSGIWDEPRAGHVLPGSFGACLDTSISSRLDATADTPGIATLLTRLSGSRAAYLDALNVSGTVASHADVAAVQNNTLVRIFVPDVVQRPQSGSIQRIVHLYTYNEQGNMATPDSAPTITVVNGAGTSRNVNLDTATMVLLSPGHYKAVYTLQAGDPTEQLVWSFTVVQNGQTRQYGGSTEVVDVMSVDFNANDRANLNALLAMAGTTGVIVASASRTGYTLSAQEHAAITADAVAALNSAVPASPTAGSVFDRLDAAVSSRSTFAGGAVASVSAPVVVGQNNDKTGYTLASSGLDAIQVEPGINARQALAPILAATAGVLSGAGTGTITVKGGSVATTRIMATTDLVGNRSAVVLNLPN